MIQTHKRGHLHPGGLRQAILTWLLVTAVSVPITVAQTVYTPVRYYTFNGSNAVTDSTGNYALNFNYYGSQYAVGTGGQVGKFLTLNSASTLVEGGALTLTNAVSVEFLLKPGYDFGISKIIHRGDGAFEIRMEYASLTFGTSHKSSSGATINDEFTISLDAIGRKSYGYYVDGNWHHLVFRFNAATGEKTIWVDGQLPAGFSKTITPGTFNSTGSNTLYLNHTISYVKYYGSIDEIAVYNKIIPDKLIYKHFLGVQNQQPYNYTDDFSGTIPSATSVTGSLDPLEFGPGYPSVNVSATDQILSFPTPRYKTGHTLHPNVPLYGIEYLGGLNQTGVSYSQALSNAKVQQVDLINNFNQSVLVTSNTGEYPYYGDTTKFGGWFIQYANQNPTKHTSAFSFWLTVNPSHIGRPRSTSYINCNCLSDRHYLRNSSNQFIDLYGNVTSSKYLSPAAPVDSFVYDGLTQRYYLQQLTNRMTRPLNLIFENGEGIPLINSSSVMAMDPAVNTDRNSSGLDWTTYEGNRAFNKVKTYRDQFMSLPALANTKFAYYQVDGQPSWRLKYSELRNANTTVNNQFYPTGDIYMRYPYNWRTWVGAWHGWQWVAESRKVELDLGDKLFGPAVAAGWEFDETKNVRPAQWLGMLKAIGMTGAEFYYTSFFNLQPPFPEAKNWAWQAVMPAYAQGITSRYEDLLRNGFLMEGDVPNNITNPSWNAFSFKSGDLRKLVVVRKLNTIRKYAITGTLQPNSSWVGNAENSGVAQIQLDGQTLKFNVRRQGSTYIYDYTNTASPVFYQLDGWHEATHPSYWSKDFMIEAELFDNNNSALVIKTSVPAGTTSGDYTNYTSYVTFQTVSDVKYNFTPRRNNTVPLYLWVRARSTNGTLTGFTARLASGTVHTFNCVKDTSWQWYRINSNNVAAVFTGLTSTLQELTISPNTTTLQIDKIHLSTDAGTLYTAAINSCSGASATITASGPTNFCQGGSVTLTANSGSSYLWSNGATTQSINTTASGTYTVMVTISGSGSAVSSPVTVNVYSLPIVTISAGSATTFCQGGSVTLTASSGSSYLWSPGNQTSQSITVSSSGAYNVRVTNSNGCSKISSNTNVTVNPLPTATISAGGSTTFCQGGAVTLTASSGSSYLWSPGNQTTQSIQANSSGTFTVRVTNSNGCYATSSGTIVTVNSLPTATISASGSLNLAQGQSVTLTASTNSAYLWSPGGQTTKSITVSTAGSYTVRVTNSYGCTAISSPAVVTVQGTAVPATITASSATSFCQGGNVTLTANSGTAYLWSTGATSQSISVSGSGTYTVTVTNNGIPSVSPGTSVTVWPLPTATITAGGSTSICSGSSVTLTAGTASSYYWLSGGQTSQSISASTAGSYQVRVTNSYGCSQTSAATNVTVTSCSTTCDKPYGLSTLGVTSNSATISWMNPGTGQTQFQVKLKNMSNNYIYITGQVPYTTTTITVGANSGTTYHWWVRSWCGSVKSTYAGYLTYTTPLPRVQSTSTMNEDYFEPLYPDPEEEVKAPETSIRQFGVYPNPAMNEVMITYEATSDRPVALTLTDVHGRVVMTRELSTAEGFNLHALETSSFLRGVYMLQIKGEGTCDIKRLVLQ